MFCLKCREQGFPPPDGHFSASDIAKNRLFFQSLQEARQAFARKKDVIAETTSARGQEAGLAQDRPPQGGGSRPDQSVWSSDRMRQAEIDQLGLGETVTIVVWMIRD